MTTQRQADVEVLLATYNGERFLREQIDSILAQDYENVRVLARDDGSSDRTVEILKEYASLYPDRFRLLSSDGATASVQNNFLQLMKASTAEYVCFSDQDDVWLAQKVSLSRKAMDRLEAQRGKDVPLLVFTDARVVDSDLRTLNPSLWASENLQPDRIDRLAAQLAQNVVTGCTCMLNRRLLDLSLRMTDKAFMHDQWIAMLACALGKAYPLKAKTMLYRQHGGNVIGTEQKGKSLSALFRRAGKTDVRIQQWKDGRQQAESFLRVYEAELSPQQRDVLEAYAQCSKQKSRVVRIGIVMRYGFWRTGFLQKLATLVDQWKMKVD